MYKRVIFKFESDRRLFFNKILKRSHLKSWKLFYLYHKIPRQTFDLYKSGKSTIPNNFYERLIKYLNKNEIKNFTSKIDFIDENWGRIKGGKENYKRNKKVFDVGRILGLSKLLKMNFKNSFDINKVVLDTKLAYFVGLWMGDGFTNKYKSHYLTQFVGHKEHELEYYKNVVCSYLIQTFNLDPFIKESSSGNFFRVNIYSKNLFNLLVKKLKLPPGKKSRIVLIPSQIMQAKKEILLSCVAGIYDAEGNVFFDKRGSYSKPYPRISLHMNNPGILNQIKIILEKEKIVMSLTNNQTMLLVYSERNIKNFLDRIPIQNPKLLNKLKLLN